MMTESVLFTGNNWEKIEDFYNIFNIQHMSKCTFELIQRMYLFSAIDEFYLRNQSVILR